MKLRVIFLTTWKLWVVVVFSFETVCGCISFLISVDNGATLTLSLSLALHIILMIIRLEFGCSRRLWSIIVIVLFEPAIIEILTFFRRSIYVNRFLELMCTNLKFFNKISANHFTKDEVCVVLAFCTLAAVALYIWIGLFLVHISYFETFLWSQFVTKMIWKQSKDIRFCLAFLFM